VSRGFLTTTREGTLLSLRVSPGAKHTSLEGPYGDSAIKLKVAAPPVDGKANAEIVRYPAELLAVPRSGVAIVRGASSRDKTVLIRGQAREQTRKTLATQPQ
jgi:uncharacterized protein